MRTSLFLEDMTRFLMSSAAFNQQELAAELSDKRGSTKKLEAALSLRLAGKAKFAEVLEGVEIIFYEHVIEQRIPFSYLQRLIDAQRIYDGTIGTLDKIQLRLHVERGKYLDDVSSGMYPKARAMKLLLEGVDGAITHKNGEPSKVDIDAIKSTAETLICAVDAFRKPEAGEVEPHPSDWFFMAYAGNMANWVISEIPVNTANEADIKALYVKLHTSGALGAMSRVATNYGWGNGERLFNLANALVAVYNAVEADPKVQNAPSILAQSVKVYISAIRMNPRFANFDDVYVGNREDLDVKDGESVAYPVDGIDEPIGSDVSLKPMLERLEHDNRVLLAQARKLIKDHHNDYLSDCRATAASMSKALAKLNIRPAVNRRKAAGMVFAACVSVLGAWLINSPPTDQELAAKPIFPLVEVVGPNEVASASNRYAGKPVFPLQVAMAKPIFPLERSLSPSAVETQV